MIIGIYKKARTNEFCEFAEYKIKKKYNCVSTH